MKNLNEVYDEILKRDRKFDVALRKPTSFIKTLTSSDQEIILAYKQNGSSSLKSPDTSLRGLKFENKDNDESVAKFDLTGNPLEDDLEVDGIDEADILAMKILDKRLWADGEELLLPISCETAREFIISININNKLKNVSDGSIWFICSSANDTGTILLEQSLKQDEHTRGIVKFLNLQKYKELDTSIIKKKHFLTIHNCQRATSDIELSFYLSPQQTIRLSWQTTVLPPDLTAFRKADIMLEQTAFIGDGSSVSDPLWLQLLLLNRIRDTIVNYKMFENAAKLNYSSGDTNSITLKLLKEKIYTILTDVSQLDNYGDDVKSNAIATDLETVIKRSHIRNLIDISDELFMVLTLASSYSDLKAAFNYLFQCSVKCNIVNIPTNENCLAKLIREISQQRLALPSLSGSEPLELLLEIGLEKLAKDYEFIFVDSKICSSKHLILAKNKENKQFNNDAPNVRKTLSHALHQLNKPKPFIATTKESTAPRHTLMTRNLIQNNDETMSFENVGFENSEFNSNLVEEKLSRLVQIHLLMEHLILIQINLNVNELSNYVIENLQQPIVPMIKYLKPNLQNQRNIFNLSDKIISKVDCREPDSIKIVMKSKNKFKKVENTFFYSVEPIFPPNLLKQQIEKEVFKTNLYYGVHYLKITDK